MLTDYKDYEKRNLTFRPKRLSRILMGVLQHPYIGLPVATRVPPLPTKSVFPWTWKRPWKQSITTSLLIYTALSTFKTVKNRANIHATGNFNIFFRCVPGMARHIHNQIQILKLQENHILWNKICCREKRSGVRSHEWWLWSWTNEWPWPLCQGISKFLMIATE